MNTTTKEKRENKRAFFTLEDNITAAIETQKKPFKKVPVTLLSISARGISFLIARQKISGIEDGDRLTVSGIDAPHPLGFIDTAEAEIKYILDFEVNIRVAIGCEFIKISEIDVEKIENYVAYRLREMGLDEKTK
ncbi:MAG: PilZ domain-containing protein [Candidatus Aminicenantes bacterium]|nr:PilZ domain-containing protein [Candidatus Aminicenantes bacterium]